MVPNGWKETKLIDTSAKEKYSFTGGPFGSDLKSSDYTDNGVRIIQLQNIGDGKFNNGYKIFTSEEKADELSSCNIFPGEIILSKMGDPVARATIIPSHHKRYLMASDGIRLKVDESKYDTFFIHEVINAPHFRGIALSKSTGSTRKRIGLTDLKNITFHCPPLIEQQKIAKILSTWDKAISTTERLIENSTQQKKALMQQLLTGKKRLLDDGGKRFEGEWEEVLLGSCADLTAGGTPSTKKPEYWGGEIPWMNSGEVNLKQVFSVEGRITQAGLDNSSTKIIPVNSILIALAGQGKTRGTVAINRIKLCTNQSIAAIMPHQDILDHDFLYFNLDGRYEELRAMSTGAGGRGGLNLSILKSIALNMPTFKEQQKIAAVLTTADKEIELLEQQLADLQQEKKALMQVLLTGKVRVLVNGEVA